MAYHGLIPSLQKLLTSATSPPQVLEIGIDRGVTLIPLVVAMASAHDSFVYMGIDVDIQESLKLTVGYLGHVVASSTFLMEANSLDLLPKIVDQGMKFDVVLLDGDHNYHTVLNELNLVSKLIKPDGIIVVDDYDGRWSIRDLWYANRSGYEENKLVTPPIQTEKSGVKPAVDEWLEQNPGWKLTKPIPGEPVVLVKN